MYQLEEIEKNAEYCLNCKMKPCSNKGCPLNNNIPEFISFVKNKDYKNAYKTLCQTTVLPGVCGLICPHQKQCQSACVRGSKGDPVQIGILESFVFEKAQEEGYCLKDFVDIKALENPKRVAIIGGGPAGLTASAFLKIAGLDVTIFEKYDYLGGLLSHGIPDFRLPKKNITATIQNILDLGIKVKYNQELGKNLTLKNLEKDYDAIFLAFGANKSTKMNVKGEELNGVFGGNELLEFNTHPDYSGKTVIICGGGNVAMDCARTVKKLGAKNVKVVYRRAREQMPAENKEIECAINEGIEFLFQNNIFEIKGEKKVNSVELIKTELVKKDGDSRLSPVNIPNSNYEIKADYVIMALGSTTDDFVKSLNLELDKWGTIKVDESHKTSTPKIYAGGELAGSKGTVAWAARSGRDTAYSIIKNLI